MIEKELVVELGTEGGGATIFRTRGVTGEWQFHVEGTSMDLDENDDEIWRSRSTEPVNSIEVALQEVTGDGSWVLFWPIAIHAEFQSAISDLVEVAVANLPAEQKEMGRNQAAEWRRLCEEVTNAPDIQVIWREWPPVKPRRGLGHGVELHDRSALDVRNDSESLVTFVDGFGWLHGSPSAIVYYSIPDGITESEFNDMKLGVEGLIRKRQVPIGQVTERIQAIPNC